MQQVLKPSTYRGPLYGRSDLLLEALGTLVSLSASNTCLPSMRFRETVCVVESDVLEPVLMHTMSNKDIEGKEVAWVDRKTDKDAHR